MSTIVFVIFALLGVPLFAIFGGLALYSYHDLGLPPIAIISEYYKLASQPVLLTIPLFTLSGYLLAESKAPDRMVNVARSWIGWMPGGLAITTIVACAFFTAFTGASGVTIIALGGLLYPILMKEGYGDKFSMGLVTSCGSLGLLFPPSLPLILYALISSGNPAVMVTVDQLFIAGIVPG
ncbi:C4-dicarboxylate ABC transporter, partial [bacterium K02(2017)]